MSLSELGDIKLPGTGYSLQGQISLGAVSVVQPPPHKSSAFQRAQTTH